MGLKLAYRHPASLQGLSTKAPTSVRSVCFICCVHACLFFLHSQFGELFSALNLSWGRRSSLPIFLQRTTLLTVCLSLYRGVRAGHPHSSRSRCRSCWHNWTGPSTPPSLHLKQETQGSLCCKRRLLPWIKAILESKAAWLWKSIIRFCHGNGPCWALRRKAGLFA